MFLTLAEVSATIGATPVWTQNAYAVLALSRVYRPADAARLGLARLLHTSFGIMLPIAWRLAGTAIAHAHQDVVRLHAPPGTVALEIDVRRYLTDWAAALARVRGPVPPRRRGRPPLPKLGAGLSAARRHGLDLTVLAASLARTPAERLRALDENWRFVRALRALRAGARR
ncbi:MAG: hypothetical protein ACRDH5_09940 [bacterium]